MMDAASSGAGPAERTRFNRTECVYPAGPPNEGYSSKGIVLRYRNFGYVGILTDNDQPTGTNCGVVDISISTGKPAPGPSAAPSRSVMKPSVISTGAFAGNMRAARGMEGVGQRESATTLASCSAWTLRALILQPVPNIPNSEPPSMARSGMW